jgi:Rieske Fe-S protein
MTCSRRCVVAGGLSLAACGRAVEPGSDAGTIEPGPLVDAGSPDAGSTCSAVEPTTSWLRVELADVPALREVGGAAIVERPSELLNVWVLHLADDCFTAVWRVCTHGACDVEPRGAASPELWCPCHGSRFDLTGSVLQGPATRALKTFEVVRRGDTLFVRR